jgi:hypothetical protein
MTSFPRLFSPVRVGPLTRTNRLLHVVGDAYAPRKAAAAVHEGHRVGRVL